MFRRLARSSPLAGMDSLSPICSSYWVLTLSNSPRLRRPKEKAARATVQSISDSLDWYFSTADTCARILAKPTFRRWYRKESTPMRFNKENTVRSFLALMVVGTLGFLVGCGGGGTPAGVPVPPPVGQNTVPIVVDGGPLSPPQYVNGAFVSVNICVPGTSTCQSVDHILVDTGSMGLRVLQTALTQVTLTPLNDGNGDTLNDCSQFLDGSYLWGTVAPADVKMASEVASSTSIQLIATPTAYSIPGSCSTNGTGTNEDTQATLGANGILGVGPEPFDCGLACDPSQGSLPTPPPY